MRTNRNSIRVIECHGTPREMGRQYGEQARAAIQHNAEYFLAAWNSKRAEVKKTGGAIRSLLARHVPEILDELEGISQSSKVDLNRLLLMNQVDTMGAMWGNCTPLAVARTDQGPLAAKNNDGGWKKKMFVTHASGAALYVVRRCRPDHGIPFMQVTYAGWLSGMDAMNAEGLGNTHGSVGSIYDKSGPRVDIRLWTYRLMQRCRTTREFAGGLMAGSLTGKGFSITAVDRAGRTVVIEAAVPLIQARAWNEPFVYSTNHYNLPALQQSDMRTPPAKVVSLRRYGYLQWIDAVRRPKRLADVKQILSSHEPWAPCRHGGAHHSETEWSMIALSQKNKVLVTDGPPCCAAYQEFSLA